MGNIAKSLNMFHNEITRPHMEDDAIHVTVAEKQAWNGKQAALTFDDVPTANSQKPVRSGGVKSAIDAVKPKSGSGAPTTSTKADFLGQTYIDTAANKAYTCVKISGSTYTWEEGGGGGSSSTLTLEAIRVKTAPTKTAYKAGETFDPAGMVVVADYALDGVVIRENVVVTDYSYPTTALAAGQTSVTITLKDKSTTTAVSVTKTSVTVPTLKGSYTYNGNTQAFQFNNEPSSSIATKSGDTSGLNAGSYTTRFTLNNTALYQWADGSTAAYKDIAATIGQKAVTISANPASVTLNTSNLTKTSTITCDGDGTLSVSSSNTSVATASISNKVVTISHVNKTSGISTVTVTHTAKAGGNYKTGSTTIAVSAAFISNTLSENSLATISEVSQAGTGDTYWDVGDAYPMKLNGTIGIKSYNNVQLYVFILHFNMPLNKTTAENNILWGGFKTAEKNGVDVGLDCAKYNSYSADGTLYFNMNHKGDTTYYGSNFGGWKGCDLRHDILGATNTAPSQYNAIKSASNVGYDATGNEFTAPKANTLLAAMPSDWRGIMRYWEHYVDNVGNSSNVDANVTKVKDAIALLSEFEIHGTRQYANQYEQNHQVQVDYYKNGNDKRVYRQSATTTAAYRWCSSPRYNYANSFCYTNTNGNRSYDNARICYVVCPAFKT